MQSKPFSRRATLDPCVHIHAHGSEPSIDRGCATAQAFYIDTDAELVRWISMHPEYSSDALTALANTVADYRGLLKAKRAALLEKVAAAAAGSGM
jgi:hypothetical protein